MPRDYQELRKAIRGKYTRMEDFAADMGLTPGTLSKKLTGRPDWKRAEIERAQELLGLDMATTHRYFF